MQVLPKANLYASGPDFKPELLPGTPERNNSLQSDRHTAKKYDKPMLKVQRGRDFIESHFYLGYSD